jgi:N-acetylneuraminate synthase
MSVYFIAEAGVNHNGSLERARELISAAVAAGANAVKFQTFRANEVVSRQAPKAAYQMETTDVNQSQLDMIRALELSELDHEILMADAKQQGIEFLSTPFDLASIRLLTGRFGLQTIKIPSGEITNPPYLLTISRLASQVILSTGMSTLGEVEYALGVLAFGLISDPLAVPGRESFIRAFCSEAGQTALQQRVTLLHCTTEYPAPYAEVNLLAMDTLREAFKLPVGYSDHTLGIHISLAAVARGAQVIEKHFTLDRHLPGPDHKASLEPGELKELVSQIREIESALGNGMKRTTSSEWKNRDMARKSLIAKETIEAGHLLTEANVTCKRPGTGIPANCYYEVLGKIAPQKFNPDDFIEL